MIRRRYRPGSTAPQTGVYTLVGPRGGWSGIKRRVRQGKSFPPAHLPGYQYVLLEAESEVIEK